MTLSARWVTLRGSLGDAKSSLGDAKISLAWFRLAIPPRNSLGLSLVRNAVSNFSIDSDGDVLS